MRETEAQLGVAPREVLLIWETYIISDGSSSLLFQLLQIFIGIEESVFDYLDVNLSSNSLPFPDAALCLPFPNLRLGSELSLLPETFPIRCYPSFGKRSCPRNKGGSFHVVTKGLVSREWVVVNASETES